MVRQRNHATGAQPFDTLSVADIGDVDVCLYDVRRPFCHLSNSKSHCGKTRTGSTHPCRRPRGYCRTSISLDLTHGTPFRRAWEDKLLDNSKVFQIGIRGTGYEKGDTLWGRDQGWRVVRAEECWHKSLDPLMTDPWTYWERHTRLFEL